MVSKGALRFGSARIPLALKIDVDTYRGIADGATRLAQFLHAEKIPASFFVSLGPDNSGWAATRLFRHQGFLKKMQRTSALSLYGWRTAFSGTLWPERPMAASFADRLRQWRDWGFEVSPHGFDHIRWHDDAAGWDEAEASAELVKVVDVYQHVFKENPRSFAAPGWQTGAAVWSAMEQLNLLYHSDTRGASPYYPLIGANRLRTLEIPTTMATWDEMLAWDGVRADELAERTFSQLQSDKLNVWTLHAELEGAVYFSQFKSAISRLKQQNIEWTFLPDRALALRAHSETVAICSFVQAERPGRAGKVSCQASGVAGSKV